MRILLLFLFFFSSFFANSQNRLGSNVSEEFKSLVAEIDQCIEDRNQECLKAVDELIEKGKSKRVPFLDFLYFKKARYFYFRNELDSTLYYGQLAIENFNPEEKHRSDIETHNLMANAYYFKGNKEAAMKYYLKNATVLENGGNPLQLGYLYNNLGALYGQLYDYKKEIEYKQKAFKLLEENNDENYLPLVASGLAQSHHRNKDTISAIKWANKTLSLSENSNNIRSKAFAYLSLSMVTKDNNEALGYAEQAVKNAEILKDKSIISSAYNLYAEILNDSGQPEKALPYAEKSVTIAEEIGDKMNLLGASLVAGNINFNSGRKEKAADFYHKYVNLKDSITSAEKDRIITELSVKYETEKKEKQIAEQELKIQKQHSNLLLAILGGALLISILGGAIFYNNRKQQAKLKQLQQEKENAILNSFILGEERERKRISHELHDSVATMIGAAKMSLESIPHLPQEKRMEQLAKVQRILERSHADTRHIAHNLLPTVLEQDGLVKATEHFVSEINETKLIKISVTDNHENTHKLSQQLQLMIFRVIQELVNNIIKHSEAANAEIKFSNNSNGLQIEITDDGIGYEDSEEAGNQGLYSISQRLKSIGGNFEITNRKSGGTQAKVAVTV